MLIMKQKPDFVKKLWLRAHFASLLIAVRYGKEAINYNSLDDANDHAESLTMRIHQGNIYNILR